MKPDLTFFLYSLARVQEAWIRNYPGDVAFLLVYSSVLLVEWALRTEYLEVNKATFVRFLHCRHGTIPGASTAQ